MKIWRIPVCWSVCSTIEVEADSLAEAMHIAADPEGKIPLPDDPHYIDGSWELSSEDIDEVRAFFNHNQNDEEQ